ncbi:hypothetical protein [Pedobacter jamesrossensis]|uniref:DUF4374 domain-containing protein n=1 Tax=Pedobacter jamesrossensis TaxID=1908238 RepID=A0ABV8NMP1_9SPHI
MKIKNLCLVAAGLALAIQGCKKDKTPETTPEVANYVLSVTGGVSPNQTSYLFSSKDVPTGAVGTSNALESTSSATIYKYGKYIYQNNFAAPATLTKYGFDASGKPQAAGSFAIPGLRTIGAVLFISETEAYATVASFGVTPKLVKFNPTTMQVTTTLDLTGLNKTGATEVYYMGLVQRGNNIFMGVNYQDASFSNLEDKVFVAVIDRTTDKFVKLIEDSRSSQMWNGGTDASFSPNSLIKDASGDIYVMGYANNGKPSGVLRIKNNETAFDQSYFFNLTTTAGGPCVGLFHFGHDQTFTVTYTRAAAYPFDSGTAAGQYRKINLQTQTVSGNISSTLPLIKGNKAFMTKWDDQKIYFNVAADASINSIYSYQLSNGTVKKEFDLSSGACNGFAKLVQ